jgi:regulation of enolase protein 1 (concanavalin A-like superfamily)
VIFGVCDDGAVSIEAFGSTGWRWLNEPAVWEASPGGLTVVAEPDTDFWRTTHYGFVRDTGHVLGRDVEGDFVLTASFGADYAAQYDQAGVVLRIDERNWIKSGIELVDGRHQLSAVVTRDVSDWSVVPVDGADRVTISAERTGDTVTLRCGTGDAPPSTMLRLAYLPPGVPVFAGVMCAAPDGPGFTARFTGASVELTRPRMA